MKSKSDTTSNIQAVWLAVLGEAGVDARVARVLTEGEHEKETSRSRKKRLPAAPAVANAGAGARAGAGGKRR